jgi:nitrilase
MADKSTMAAWLANYINNSLTLDSTHWKSLVKAATDNQIYVSPAFSHKQNGALYMAQGLLSPDGTSFVRHKLRPSGGEREIWSDGTTDDLKVIATPYGRWGILECWEHFHPAMTFITQAQSETLHIGVWPCRPIPHSILFLLMRQIDTPDVADASAAYWESLEVNLAAARVYAVNTNAPLVFASVGNVRFLDAQGMDLTVVDAKLSTKTQPLVYQSFNTTGLAATVPYTTDGEQSWGILRQMVASFPFYIPKVVGAFVANQIHPIADLLASLGDQNIEKR